MQNTKIFSLLYADDLILLSDSKHGLRRSLDILYLYAKKWCLKINTKKSNVVVFRNPGVQHHERVWNLGRSDDVLPETNNYKYLGIWFSNSGLTQFTLKQRALAGNRAKFALINSLRSYNLNPKLVCQLFDNLVTSSLLYGAEVWGFLDTKINIEKVHTSFIRQYLGVRKSTPLLALYGELGRIPLAHIAFLRMLRFWIRILSLPQSRFVKLAYLEMLDIFRANPIRSPWCEFLSSALARFGLADAWNNQVIPNPNSFYIQVRSKVFEYFTNSWLTGITTYSSLETYVLFKTTLCLENYLSCIKDKRHLKAFTRFRLHSHNLAIETGRHSRPFIPRRRRLCQYCNTHQVEDEIHFLISCPLYDELREPLLIFIQNIPENDGKFRFLMQSSAPRILRLTAKFLYLAFMKRKLYVIS
jgi:hypothetical protein